MVKCLKLFFLLLCFFGVPSLLFSQPVLQWDLNPDADYYIVYWGSSPGDYSEGFSADIPYDTTNYEISDLCEGIRYYSVKAFNACGNSSDFSNEVKISSDSVSDPIRPDAPARVKSSSGGCFIYFSDK